jgi:hypothetical protein
MPHEESTGTRAASTALELDQPRRKPWDSFRAALLCLQQGAVPHAGILPASGRELHKYCTPMAEDYYDLGMDCATNVEELWKYQKA